MDTVLNFIHVAGNVLLHSMRTAAFCWTAVCLAAAVLIIRGLAREMDAILQLKHTGYRSISCKMGVFSPMEAAKQEEMK